MPIFDQTPPPPNPSNDWARRYDRFTDRNTICEIFDARHSVWIPATEMGEQGRVTEREGREWQLLAPKGVRRITDWISREVIT